MKTLQEIKDELILLKDENLKAIKSCKAEIAENEKNVAVAKERIYKAQKDIDAKAYDKAKRDLWLAENTEEMLKNRLHKLTTEPLMNFSEYRQLVNKVHKLHQEIQDNLFEEARSVLPKLENISSSAEAEYETCSEILSILKTSISKEKDEYTKNENGHVDSNLINMQPRLTNYFPQVIRRIEECMTI